MTPKNNPIGIGDVRALEHETDPVRRQQLVMRILFALTKSDIRELAGLFTPQQVETIITERQDMSWCRIIEAHHAGHEKASEHECLEEPDDGEPFEALPYAVTTVDENYNWDEGSTYWFGQCPCCLEHLQLDQGEEDDEERSSV